MHTNEFDEHHVLHELMHFLPAQTPLKDFIHHNSLHALQHLKFYDAIFTGAAIFGFQPTFNLNEYRNLYKSGRIRPEVVAQILEQRKGRTNVGAWTTKLLTQQYDPAPDPRVGRLRMGWKAAYHLDLDNLVQPLLFRILCSYLDQGIAIKHFPYENEGLLNAVRILETNSYSSFFKTKSAQKLLLDPAITLQDLLHRVVGDSALYEQYLYDQQFSHRGWSGMVATIEAQPDSILYSKKIALKDLIMLELVMEIDALNAALGENWLPLAQRYPVAPIDLFAPSPRTEREEVLSLWQDAFEWNYYDEVLVGLKYLNASGPRMEAPQGHGFQAIFCIDERECSFRRHTEAVAPHCATFGCPGFFGVEFYFQPENGKFYEKLCPAPVTPKYLIKERNVTQKRQNALLYNKKTHTFLEGFFWSLSLGLVAAVQLVVNIFNPKKHPAFADSFTHMSITGELQVENISPDDRENGWQVGFTVPEMATRVEALLRGIGMIDHFAPFVYVMAHGSSSANNPHQGAYNCGACSGRPGAVNARVLAFMANHPKVRAILAANGLVIPDSTHFVGAMHDTASDVVVFYDEHTIDEAAWSAHLEHKLTFEKALDLNAKERSRRFASINTRQDIKKIREDIRKRSVSLFEPRPEFGHGTNALCFVGKRNLTKGLFLDRRAFMNSYDYRTDPDGALLLGVMRPLPPVCGGINLEYYFSRVDNQKMGAGTKLPHNVMGLIGVANSSDGDLRPGLPLQTVEVHDPVRLMILVEHDPEVVLQSIQSDTGLYEWFANEWVHLLAIRPKTGAFYYFKNGKFELYEPLGTQPRFANDVLELIESAKEMETSHITDSTLENLPVHIINEASL